MDLKFINNLPQIRNYFVIDCQGLDTDEYSIKFQRKLRVAKSELGEYDPAALFEKSKSKTIMYFANPESGCLV